MHQLLSDESLILPTTSQLLNPSVKRALGVLDARLEDELARYRRYRNGLRVAPSAVSAIKRGAKGKSQMASPPIQAPTFQSNPPIAPEKPVEPASPQLNAIATHHAVPLPPPVPVSLQNNPSEMLALTLAADTENTVSQDSTIGESVSQFSSHSSADDLSDGFFTDSTVPNDYMESSEELLRSLAEEEANVTVERNVLEGLLTPFGVGSMMLMLLGSGMFGYLIMNPASLNAVKGLADRLVAFRSRPAASTGLANQGSVDILGGSSADMGWLSNAPALDSDEFLSLSLNNFSALRTRPGGNGLSPLAMVSKDKPGASGLAKLNNKREQKKNGISSVLKNFAPLSIKPLVPPAPAIAGDSGGGFAAPIRVAKSYEGGGGSYNPPPQIEAPTSYEAPRRPSRSYAPPAPAYQEPSYSAPVRSYDPPAAPKVYTPSVPVVELPPPPVEAPVAAPTPQGDYRVVTPYTNDAALEAAQKSDPTASFRNLDDGAYIQRGASYGTKEEAEAKAAELKQQGVEAEVK